MGQLVRVRDRSFLKWPEGCVRCSAAEAGNRFDRYPDYRSEVAYCDTCFKKVSRGNNVLALLLVVLWLLPTIGVFGYLVFGRLFLPAEQVVFRTAAEVFMVTVAASAVCLAVALVLNRILLLLLPFAIAPELRMKQLSATAGEFSFPDAAYAERFRQMNADKLLQ